jgi:uncharacterized protein YcbX
MHLSEINIYPVKSLRGIPLSESIVERRGLQFDRRWMLVDQKNQFFTQREFPKMATLVPEIKGDGLQISAGESRVLIPFETNSAETARVKIWKSSCRARVYEDSINEFFRDVLETDCKLVVMPEETERRVNRFYAVKKDDHVSFADGYPFLLIGENSLADLNERLADAVPMNRFRPNLVVSGAGAFAEDGWKKIRIGEAIFHIVKPCARCVMTTIDQIDGVKTGVEPLKTLAGFRVPKRSVKKKILFGQNLIAESAGAVLRVGDEFEILETKAGPKFT